MFCRQAMTQKAFLVIFKSRCGLLTSEKGKDVNMTLVARREGG